MGVPEDGGARRDAGEPEDGRTRSNVGVPEDGVVRHDSGVPEDDGARLDVVVKYVGVTQCGGDDGGGPDGVGEPREPIRAESIDARIFADRT